jgi:hypothetical protein
LFLRIALATVTLANALLFALPGFGLLHAQRCSPAASSSAVKVVLHPQLLQLLQVVVVVGQVLHGLLQHFSASAESPTSDLPGRGLPHAQRCSPAASSS